MGLSEKGLNLPMREIDQPGLLQLEYFGLPHLRYETDAGQQQTYGEQVDISAHSDRNLHVFLHHTPVE